MTRVLTYVEIDVDRCALTYGVAPCAATLEGENPTGTHKCFNTLSTCQDAENFSDDPVTLRFAVDADYLPADIEAIASVTDVSISPARISLGEDLGLRAEARVTFRDHPWPDTGAGGDPYLSDRAYDPWRQGTFWGKFRARRPYLRGKPLRVIRGEVGQSLAQMETRHYVIDSFDFAANGSFTVVGKDPLKLLDGDRAQAPRLSEGFLVGPIDADDTSLTLSPAGIGDTDYPASGYAAIGGKEIVAFTRDGDTMTLTERGALGTEAAEHDAEDRVQLVLRYVASDSADIIADLMETYGGVAPAFVPLAAWEQETGNFLRRVYTGTIAEPTPVKDLVSELVEQAALAIWWDEIDQEIELRVLRAIPTTADRFTPETILAGSLRTSEQPGKRLSQVWVYYGQRNPLESVDDPDNYRSVAVTIDADAEANYGSPAIRKIFSRWIPAFGRAVATRLGAIQLGRFRDAPRKFSFDLLRGGQEARPGTGYRLEWHTLQDALGAQSDAPIQVTRLAPSPAVIGVEAEEQLFAEMDPEDLINRIIIVESNTLNFDLREVHDTLFPDLADGDSVTCIVNAGVIVGATDTASFAFTVGEWPEGFTPKIVLNGRIEGAGGRGGGLPIQQGDRPGLPGGPALYTRHAVEIDGDGEIWGGGGGGGSNMRADNQGNRYFHRGGGGGAGQVPGLGGFSYGGAADPGDPGTTETGGLGGHHAQGPGGSGGNPGEPGQRRFRMGGLAGDAIDGDSLVTLAGTIDIRGERIN